VAFGGASETWQSREVSGAAAAAAAVSCDRC
jgi:hypothetical protein